MVLISELHLSARDTESDASDLAGTANDTHFTEE